MNSTKRNEDEEREAGAGEVTQEANSEEEETQASETDRLLPEQRYVTKLYQSAFKLFKDHLMLCREKIAFYQQRHSNTYFTFDLS